MLKSNALATSSNLGNLLTGYAQPEAVRPSLRRHVVATLNTFSRAKRDWCLLALFVDQLPVQQFNFLGLVGFAHLSVSVGYRPALTGLSG